MSEVVDVNKFKLKSKKILSFIVLICLFLSLSTGALAFEPALEDGTKDNPYIITSQNDLLKFKSMMVNDDSICARLEDDIELDGDWRAIKSYSGVFDGNYHKITLTGYSLFTRAEDGAIIKNLMIDGTVNGGNHVAPFMA